MMENEKKDNYDDYIADVKEMEKKLWGFIEKEFSDKPKIAVFNAISCVFTGLLDDSQMDPEVLFDKIHNAIRRVRALRREEEENVSGEN